MLAWAPAIDKILKDHGVSATLLVSSACPPLVGVANEMRPTCEKQSARLVTNLRDVDVVVMTAFWRKYQDGFQRNELISVSGKAAGVVKEGLPRTVKKLVSEDVDVYLLGPVPTYEESIPFQAANSAMNGRKAPIGKNAKEHQFDNMEFFSLARDVATLAQIVDPSEWMCSPICAVRQGQEMLYRDGNHLSITGAIHYSGRLAEALAALLEGDRASDDAGVQQANSAMRILEQVSSFDRHSGKSGPHENIGCRVGAGGCE